MDIRRDCRDPAGTVDHGRPVLLSRKREGCLALDGAVLLAIRRAPLTPADGADLRRSMDAALAAHPRGVVMITAMRLSPEFPVTAEHEASLGSVIDTVRTVDRVVRANATVIEFGGLRAAAVRLASRATWSLAGLRSALGHFDRLSDAIPWILPHARAVGAPEDPSFYVRLYRQVDRELELLDAERRARSA